ncbi:Ankyrin repeat family protein [Euphorbia peplus]|nr:Ankyrin repeat family protein [Euphorbia peplus]
MYASSSIDHGSSTHIDADLYKAATNGAFEKFKNYAQPLNLLLGQNNNTILHIYLTSPFKRSKEFVEKVLGQCPQLLWLTNNAGAIPLHIAAKYGHLDIVKLFIEEAKKPIHRDLETGEDEAARRMLRLANKHKETALHLAIRGNYPKVVKEILKHEDPYFTYTANISGESPLYLAVYKYNDEGIATEILKKFESPDCGGPNGRTAIHAVATYIYFDESFLDLLLSKLVSFVNQADETGWTPLHSAAYSNNLKLVTKILEKDKHSAYATDKYRHRTALHMASCVGNVGIIKEMIGKCPECCEITDVRGWNILHYAVIRKSDEAVKTIMRDPSLVYLVNERDIKGYTPLRLLFVFKGKSSLRKWIGDKSDVPSDFLYNEVYADTKEVFRHGVSRSEEEILEWMGELGKDPFGTKIVGRLWEEVTDSNNYEKKVIHGLEKVTASHLVVAALVATVTFAAAFTLPGGYISNEKDHLKGTPILSKSAAFKAFVVTDAIAMVFSTSSMFIHFIIVLAGYKPKFYWLIDSAFWFIMIAMGAMVVAFVTGTYAVLAPSSMGLAIATCLIGLTYFLLAPYAIIGLFFSYVKRFRAKDTLRRRLQFSSLYLSWDSLRETGYNIMPLSKEKLPYTPTSNQMYASSSRDHVMKHIDADLYKAAKKGSFEMFKNYAQPLDHLLGQNRNTILHVYLNSPFERSKDFVKEVLRQCPQVLLQPNNDGATRLHVAAKYDHLDIVKLFIEEAKKPIHRDLETGEEEATRRMLRLTNKHKDTALHLAIIGNCLSVVQEILKHEDPHFTYTANIYRETPLFLAVNREYADIAIEILNKFESPDCGGPNGRTVFHAVVFYSYSSITVGLSNLLFSKLGSFVNQADESGWTPLHYAAYSNNSDIVKRILGEDKGSAYATDKYRNRTALHIASCRGSVSIMEQIIDKCPECCEIKDVRGWNVLHYAVISQVEAAVRAIMKDSSLMHLINERDTKGYTPLLLLQASRQRSSLLSWIYEKSPVPPKYFENELYSTYMYFLDDEDKDREEILEWMEDLGMDPLGRKIVGKRWEEKEDEIKEKVIPELEKAKESHLVAAALVATVTFAAAFTLPGGYISDGKDPNLKGTPFLSRNAAFTAFCNRCNSHGAFYIFVLAMGAMVVAFVTGTYAVLAPPAKGLAIATCVIGSTLFLRVAYTTVRLIVGFVKRDRIENPELSTTESLCWVLQSAPEYLLCGTNRYWS